MVKEKEFEINGKDNSFYARFIANIDAVHSLYKNLYGHHPQHEEIFSQLLQTISNAYQQRPAALIKKDIEKNEDWFLSNEIVWNEFIC